MKENFEVRVVDPVARVYRRVASYRFFHDACWAADFGVETYGEDYVVRHRDFERVLYDSRRAPQTITA